MVDIDDGKGELAVGASTCHFIQPTGEIATIIHFS
ncbi:hypothetical protein AND4_07164 [Vibrio sp. AND4]|nr:hypothetical protein AND4_07164 [Vibrio sp. AND4]